MSHTNKNAEFVEFITTSDLVKVKSDVCSGNELLVVKYKHKVFYNNLWNEHLVNARGLVLDTDYNIVSYPFTKIFNYGVETSAPEFDDHEPVLVQRKVNGFMCAMTWYNNSVLVSTTGSVSGVFVDYAREFLTPALEKELQDNPTYTYMFECVHPADPHIIPEEQGLYYLARRAKCLNSPIETPDSLRQWLYTFVDHVVYATELPFGVAVTQAKSAKDEGSVIYSLRDTRATKVKSSWYLCSKALARTKADTVSRIKIDEEFADLSKLVETDAFKAASEQQRLTKIREFYGYE
jgi:hypothetical protein